MSAADAKAAAPARRRKADAEPAPAPKKKAAAAPAGNGRVDDRPAQLLEIARRLFATRGYDGTSLRDIAQEASITKAALYYHFPNKEALYQQIVLEGTQALYERVQAAIAAEPDASGKVRAFMRASAEAYAESPHAWRASSNAFWTSHSDDFRARAVGLRDRYEKLLRACIAEGVESGEFREVDPAIADRLLLSALNQLSRWHKPGGRLSAPQVIEQYLDIILTGLQAPRRRR